MRTPRPDFGPLAFRECHDWPPFDLLAYSRTGAAIRAVVTHHALEAVAMTGGFVSEATGHPGEAR